MSTKQILTGLFAAVVLLACQSGAPTETPTPPPIEPTPTPTRSVALIDVVIYDSYYGEQNSNTTNPPVWEVPANGDVILNVENRGQLRHNWAIVKKGITPPVPYEGGQDDEIILYGAGMVYSNNKTTVTFVAPTEPGEYLVMCTVANHYPLMQGRLVVK